MGLRAAQIVALACAMVALATFSHAQPAEPTASGYWRSAQKTAGFDALSLTLHHTVDGTYHGLAARGDAAWPVRNISVVNGRLSFVVPAIEALFVGQWDSATKQWRGSWSEGGKTARLNVGRGGPPKFTAKGDPYAKPQRLVALPDGRWMNLYCLGKGAPTVILDSDIGGGAADWAKVHKELSRSTRVCAYDRAGYGFSDPGPLPRESAAVAGDLAALLKAASIRGPYVLVGHSAASLNIRLFANWRFDDIAGMVLVDPSGDFQQARFEAVLPRLRDQRLNAGPDRTAACLDIARRGLLSKDSAAYRDCRENDPARLETPGSESAALDSSSSAQNLVTQRKYDSLPLVVLTRDQAPRPGLSAAEVGMQYAVWTRIHDEFASLSTRGQRRTVPGAGHNIPNDKPQAVIDAVREVIAQARTRRRGTSV